MPLARDLVSSSSNAYRVLLYDRGDDNPKANVANGELLQYLSDAKLPPPYVLIAHSYGGNFARDFLQRCPDDVAGMILAETGQETALDLKIENEQYRRTILGRKPLSVIRCNSLIGKWVQHEMALEAAENDEERAALNAQEEFLQTVDKEDERLKKQQLNLSKNTHYVHIPDCGHGVIRDRPDVVAEEVRWVMENLHDGATDMTIWQRLSNAFKIFTGGL
jgi:pimeloyl-ACP methyl ester carboxylesterase